MTKPGINITLKITRTLGKTQTFLLIDNISKMFSQAKNKTIRLWLVEVVHFCKIKGQHISFCLISELTICVIFRKKWTDFVLCEYVVTIRVYARKYITSICCASEVWRYPSILELLVGNVNSAWFKGVFNLKICIAMASLWQWHVWHEKTTNHQ